MTVRLRSEWPRVQKGNKDLEKYAAPGRMEALMQNKVLQWVEGLMQNEVRQGMEGLKRDAAQEMERPEGVQWLPRLAATFRKLC